MKIYFVVSSLQQRSGVERVISILANSLQKKQFQIYVLNRDTTQHECAFLLHPKIQVLCLNGSLFEFYQKINQQIKNIQPDIIFIHNMGKLTPFCLLLNSKIPMISLEHVAFSSRSLLLRTLSKLIYPKIDHVITLTYQDLHSYQTFLPSSRISVIYNPTPFQREYVSASNRLNTITAVGRLTYQKNFHHLIQAWAMLGERSKGWKLEIYGEGEDKPLLEKLIIEQKIENVFIQSNTADIQSVYQKSSFLVMSSRYEGLPMVLIEALSFGLPVISYDCPHGPAEIIEHNVNGLLVENQNIHKLSAAISQLIENNHLRYDLSKGAVLSAKKFNIETIIQQWIDLFYKVKN